MAKECFYGLELESPDPLVQAPYNSQSYNRYSYVFNNPTSIIDPTGYSGKSPYDTDDRDDHEEMVVEGHKDDPWRNMDGKEFLAMISNYNYMMDLQNQTLYLPWNDSGQVSIAKINFSPEVARAVAQGEAPQQKMERLAEKAYGDYPSLRKHGMRVVHQTDVRNDNKSTGDVSRGRADISNRTIYVEDLGQDVLSTANIIHEMLHVDEAVYRLGNYASDTTYYIHELFTGGHDNNITRFGEDYMNSFLYDKPKPDINSLPWRK